ncbi:arf-GAP with SH3 domain, ANK repeat and PH domain-containing protein 1 isoform X3 [Stegostoma tigrinum]|uniref:arf-GAP with SH3 domain, ANK repeat and PH domain-containing protein 1 isoform X3 n=1 Tax=Stegostoma tigrinum TaxID=3053191 RepID=UPI00202B3137|nr:arf-GAP with SH3 domain, ANK repeat and PH domain-containing protein 1 isoform X3 [Stegostoma tigrinum]
MPEVISVQEFICETLEDHSSPTTSSFTTKMANCRNTVTVLEESLDKDRSVLQKMKKAVKVRYTSGQEDISLQETFINELEKLVVNFQSNEESVLAEAFSKFAESSKELLTPMKNLMQSVNHIVFFLNSLLKGELKGVKGDLKKPFEKAWKDYESKFTKIEKEKRELAKQYGMVRIEVTGGEIAEEMEKERRMFQLQMCEYLIKVNEIKTKKGVDLLQNLTKYYHAQFIFFQEGLKTAEKIKHYVEMLTADLQNIKQNQDEEKKQLCSLRDQLKPTLQLDHKEDSVSRQSIYSMHQLQGNKQYGTEKTGILYKKSDGLRKVWQKRKCIVKNCYLIIPHGTPNRQPAKLNLLTCQVKPSLEDKKCFDLISHNRTYHFLADDEQDCMAWISVLTNCKQEALNMAFREHHSDAENSIEDLTKAIIEDVLHMPGNNECCDCRAAGPTWLSTNLGILICIECSGIHREMGVHYSRIQSLSLDKLGTSELLVVKNVGNSRFNELMEATLPSLSVKPTTDSPMAMRKDYITSKYIDRQYAKKNNSTSVTKLNNLYTAVKCKDIFALIQAYAEKVNLSESLPSYAEEPGETALHLAVQLADLTSLHIVDFLVQNCGNLSKQTIKGNTAVHYSCIFNKPECLKLLLRAKTNTTILNENGETAVDIAHRLKHQYCEELLTQAKLNRFNLRTNVEYEWRLGQDDDYESDDDLDEKGPIKRERSLRPYSCYQPASKHSLSVDKPNSVAINKDSPCVSREHRREQPCGSTNQSRSTESQPFSPVSEAPPIPPRIPIKGLDLLTNNTISCCIVFSAPSVPPPPPPHPPFSVKSTPPGSAAFISDSPSTKKRPPLPPLTTKHKRTLSEPTPRVPHSPLNRKQSSFESTPPSSPPPPVVDRSSPRPSLQSPKVSPGLHALPELPETVDQKKPEQIYAIPKKSQNVADASQKSPWPTTSPVGPFFAEPNNDVYAVPGNPIPLPRKMNMAKPKVRRGRAIYNCTADHADELTFKEGEMIVVTGEEDQEWWNGYIDGQPHRKGLFPASFIQLQTS